MIKEKPAYWGVITADVRYCEDITPNAKLLFSEMTALCNKEGHCWATNQYFADLYEVTPQTVSTWISSLIKEGFILSAMVKTGTGSKRKMWVGGLKEILKGGLKDNHKSIVNSTSINNNKEDDSSSSNLKRSFGYRCIKIWNAFPYTMNHRSPAIIKTIDTYMKELMKGTFPINRVINEGYFERHKIIAEGVYTKSELIQGIKNVALYSKEGYQHMVTKDLSSLIYNPRTGTSIFLSVIDEPPKPLSEERPIHDATPKLTALFTPLFNGTIMEDKVRLIEGIHTLNVYQKKIHVRIPKMERLFGTPYKLCKTYIEWLEDQEWLEEIKVGHIKSDGKMFRKFVDDMEEECNGYKLVVGKR